MDISHHKKTTNKLTTILKETLFLLQEGPKTDLELLATIPNFSLDLLGKLRETGDIDHYNNLVYITSSGEALLANIESNGTTK